VTPEKIIGKLEKRIAKIFGLREYVPALEAELQPLADLIRAAQDCGNAGRSDFQEEQQNLRAALEKLGSI
jgi:hypothetical protein